MQCHFGSGFDSPRRGPRHRCFIPLATEVIGSGLVFRFRHRVEPSSKDLLPLNGLDGTLDVKRRCQLTEITFRHIDGGLLVARGRIQNVPGDTRGAVLVRLASIGFLSAGMSLGERGDGLSLFAGDGWLAEHLTTLDEQAALARTHACDSSPKEVCD